MSRKKTLLAILLGFVVAVAVPLSLRLAPHQPQTHVIDLTAKKYGYEPGRIVVNKGDTVVLRPTSLDVTHGF
ncbi:MAG: cytochrome c oxidase subunit II, partial [Deltaproteobacteria bacterium]